MTGLHVNCGGVAVKYPNQLFVCVTYSVISYRTRNRLFCLCGLSTKESEYLYMDVVSILHLKCKQLSSSAIVEVSGWHFFNPWVHVE